MNFSRLRLMPLNNYLALTLAMVSVTSCLKDDTDEKKAEEKTKIENYRKKNGYAETDTISDGIYFKVIDESDGPKPTSTDYVIVSITGKSVDNEVFQTTDSATAKKAGFYRGDVIFGPVRIITSQNLEGLRETILHMNEGSKAQSIVPSEFAYWDYEPVVYDVILHRIIKAADIKKYEFDQAFDYATLNGITDKYIDDTVKYPKLDSSFFKIITEGSTPSAIVEGDSVKITLYGYYAETDTAYITGTMDRRMFFPINTSGTKVNYIYGLDQYFPLSEAVDSAVVHMNLGAEWDLVVNSDFAFGPAGFKHPSLGVDIVPKYMSAHYRIKLNDVKHEE